MRAARLRSVSGLLDRLVSDARASGHGPVRSVRSVIGTVDIDSSDPGLEAADEAVRSLFDALLNRPLAKETPTSHGHRRRSRRTRSAAAFFARCENQQCTVYVPAAVIWECSLLARLSKINRRRPVRACFDDFFTNPAYQPIELTPEQLFVADELRFNRDPFDALICPAACTMSLPLITRDGEIRGSGIVSVIW